MRHYARRVWSRYCADVINASAVIYCQRGEENRPSWTWERVSWCCLAWQASEVDNRDCWLCRASSLALTSCQSPVESPTAPPTTHPRYFLASLFIVVLNSCPRSDVIVQPPVGYSWSLLTASSVYRFRSLKHLVICNGTGAQLGCVVVSIKLPALDCLKVSLVDSSECPMVVGPIWRKGNSFLLPAHFSIASPILNTMQ